ncbi:MULTISPECIES: type II toxin-antitoxin system PemK/MazF family toxin [unclassified Adlercreutzia]|uniref:type II toxin-antitoxin system PemK/MazF family toxin n=1 Tax=unclassified Adlercreutzia TaxID=2636013 RepID=UPI0013EADCB7|nr:MULTISPECIES: type II toxin-antitoxin system PemK/MazF family toxin [unclassified Adlercreutzia]
MLFEQGDIIEVNFNPTVGHEPQKRRPALVVSVGYFNNVVSSLVVVCPITSATNGHPLHIELAPGNVAEGCVCVEQMRAIDLDNPARGVKHLGSAIDSMTMSLVLDAIGAVFGI